MPGYALGVYWDDPGLLVKVCAVALSAGVLYLFVAPLLVLVGVDVPLIGPLN